MLKREISKTDNNLFRSRTYTRVPRPATVALCGEIAPFNYADQSSPPPPSPAGPVQVHSNASDPDGPAILMRASAIWSINTEVMESRGTHLKKAEERESTNAIFIYSECLIDAVSRRKEQRAIFSPSFLFYRRERIKMGGGCVLLRRGGEK